MSTADLGLFLRAKREAGSPDALPFAPQGRRRVSGLRRDEVAVLAGLSVDYYTRMEQGRERHPSKAVVDALSDALSLSLIERRYLYRLADLMLEPPRSRDGGPVDPRVVRLVESWRRSVAYVVDPVLDFVAMTAMAEAVFEPFSARRNMAEMVFLDPAASKFLLDWEWSAQTVVAMLRLTAPLARQQPRLEELIVALSDGNPRFAGLWERHDVTRPADLRDGVFQSAVGSFDVNFQTFPVLGEPAYQLVVYVPVAEGVTPTPRVAANSATASAAQVLELDAPVVPLPRQRMDEQPVAT